MKLFASRFLACAVLLVLSGQGMAAPGAKTEKASTVEAIRKALESPGNFEFTGVTLEGVINTLSEQYKIPIVIDRTVIQQMGMEPSQMNVELKLKEGKLRTALRSLVGQYNLTCAIVGDTLLITTEEAAVYRQLKQQVNVDFEAVPLQKALKEVSNKYGVKIIIDPRSIKSKAADNPVTLQIDDVPLEAAVRLLCEMADLKPARMGNVIFVTTEARADKLKDGDSLVAPPGANPGLPGINLPPGAGGGGGIGIGIAVPAGPVAIPQPAVDTPAPGPAPKKE